MKKSKPKPNPRRTPVTPPKSARPDADRRARQSARLARSLKILELIQGRGRWNATELAREIECSERTVYRDLNALELAGVPWYLDEQNQSYRVRPGYRFPQVNLTPDELLDQAVATNVAAAPGLSIGRGAKTATDRLTSAATEDTAKLLDEVQQLVSVLGMKLADHSQHGEAIKTIQWSLLKRQQLATTYRSPYQEQPVKLTLHPYRLCLAGQAWYLIARAADSDRPKTYRVQRFQTVRALDRPASTPSDFDLRTYFGNAWNVFRGDQTYEIEIEFSADSAPFVTEAQWHHTQTVKARHKDGRVVLGFTVDGLDEIVWWLMGWAGGAKVLKPDELRARLVTELETALKLNRT